MSLEYNLEEDRVCQFLEQQSAKKAAIQLPGGIRLRQIEVAKVFEKKGVQPVFMAGSCFGACDLADRQAKQLGCDVLVHYGHADMGLSTCLPTLYVEARAPSDPSKAVEKAISGFRFKRVGLITTIQHVGHLEKVTELLRSRGLEPVVGGPGPRARYPGQLLGCDFGCATSISSKVDGFIYIGTGNFHPLGAALATGKEVLAVNPTDGARPISPDLGGFIRGRKAAITAASAAERVGVVASSKPGQARLGLAEDIVETLRKAGREASLLVVDDVVPESLADFGLDAAVCTACPRIATDDVERFEFPVITPFEAKVMLGLEKLEPYRLDEFSR
ncbi:MAG: diphthamide biosynthesis enzyme Dph2 [Candidatus Hadarchaeota archaeon]